MICSWMATLAEVVPWDDAPASPPPAASQQRPMNFSDLQQGFRQWHEGTTSENTFRNGMLVVVALVAVVALVVHLRQRRRAPKTINSPLRLGMELSRQVPFPFGSRIMLWWVARSTGLPLATLLISAAAFRAGVEQWSAEPTFGLLRRWGRSRLERLQPVLFDPPEGQPA